MLVARNSQVAEGALVAVLDPCRRDHLGADETGTEPPSLPPERLDADARHRREHDPGRHLDVRRSTRNPAGSQASGDGIGGVLTGVDRGGTMRDRRRPVRRRPFHVQGVQEAVVKEVVLTPDGYKKLQTGDRGAVDRSPPRRRRAHPNRARVRRYRGERGIRLRKERPGPSRSAHCDARGAAQERPRRHAEGDPLGRGLGRDEGAAQGHGLEQDGRVPRRRLGGG